MTMQTIDVGEGFLSAMRRLATTVSVVSCACDGIQYGMTVTAVTSVCADPAAVLICLNANSTMHDPLLAEGRFYLNLLRSSHVDISRAFSGRLKGSDRFSVGDWKIGEYQHPYLTDAQANLLCSIDRTVRYGTHTIVIGRVDGVRLSGEIAPLIYQDGGYAETTVLLESAA